MVLISSVAGGPTAMKSGTLYAMTKGKLTACKVPLRLVLCYDLDYVQSDLAHQHP